MGSRSMNYIALKPGVKLTEAVSKYLNKATAEIVADERGTLFVYESNFTPMWARDGHGENCTFDLEEEIAIQRYLGSIPVEAFYMKRAGEQCDYRGKWEDHAFKAHDTVLEIEADYLADDPWPNGATVRLRWVGPGVQSEADGWAKRDAEGKLVSSYSLLPLDASCWSVVEERVPMQVAQENKPQGREAHPPGCASPRM